MPPVLISCTHTVWLQYQSFSTQYPMPWYVIWLNFVRTNPFPLSYLVMQSITFLWCFHWSSLQGMYQDIGTDHYCIHHWSWICARISRLLHSYQSVWYQANHCITIEFHIWAFWSSWSHHNDECNKSYWYNHWHIAINIWRSLLINCWMWMRLSNKLRVYLFER